MVDLNKKDWTVEDDLAYIAELKEDLEKRKKERPKYPTDLEGNQYENSSKKKHKMKNVVKKA